MKLNEQCILIGMLMTISVLHLHAQTVVSGKVVNKKKEPIAAASVRVKEFNIGMNADSLGNFSLNIPEKGKRTLQISSVGYGTKEMQINIGDSALHLEIVLRDEAKPLADVVVSAGSFEASDKAKGASLTPMDAVTVAGNGGDISNAMRSLPGAQQIGEKEGLFVRGGTSEEAKQFVDGVLLKNPNYSSVPGIPQPARLNPFLFKGILFNTGGYSALYGEALSSALILESMDLPDKSSAGLHIFPMSVGAGFQKLAANNKSSYGVNTNYGTYALYNKVVDQKPDFFHDPEYIETDANFRIKTSKTGILKFYTNYGYDHTGMQNPDIDSSNLLSSYEVQGRNFYANLSYRELLSKNWKIDAAAAYNYYKGDVTNQLLTADKEQVFLPFYPYNEKNYSENTRSDFAQGRAVLSRMFQHNQTLRFGAEYFYYKDDYKYNDTLTKLNDNLVAAFAETDIRINKYIAARIGARAEHSSLLQQSTLVPRISVAYKFNDGGQINLAYGMFYQKPEIIYLSQNRNLDFTEATHYIINYQKKAGNRLFRIEAYYKKYKDLITTEPTVKNNGDGYAKGIELFWRDKKTFKDFDYWVTYTYLDTKRKFLDYPYSMEPTFATPHTASIAIKRFFPDINLSANMSYSLATGRPYYDIRADEAGKNAVYDKGITNWYNAMNLSLAYLFSMFKKWRNKDFSGIGFGINNVFGTKQIFGYDYNYDGRHKTPITQPATRSYYIGIFMSFGIDRRNDFINEKL
ncbi:MAG TPA: TonB-dependent receptor [Chitinophagaceae bacterium]